MASLNAHLVSQSGRTVHRSGQNAAQRAAVPPRCPAADIRPHLRPVPAGRGPSRCRATSHEEASTSTSEPGGSRTDAALPFAVSPDFLDSCRDYLIEEEGMDPTNEDALELAIADMAREMCEMALADGDDALDAELAEALLEQTQPYVDSQLHWEDRLEEAGLQLPDLSLAAAGFASGEDPALPDGVNAEALQQMQEWEEETASTTGGAIGSLGWNSARGGLHPATATLVIGVDGWRIGSKMNPIIQILAANIEAYWRQLFPGELAATAMDPRWKLVDSCDYNQRGMAWGTADPAVGDDAYPRMVLENRCYETDVFRNLHLELVLRQDGLQVLHCVMWPRREYELPILGMDIVVAPSGSVQYVIADTSPVTRDVQLPPVHLDAVRMLRAQFAEGFAGRGVPEWGKEIFSDEVVAARPGSDFEAELFVMYALAVMRAHILYAKRSEPVTEAERLDAIDAAHRRYCKNQRSNAKTRAVISHSFKHLGSAGDLFVERYMREVLFDHEFHYDVSDETKTQLRNANSDVGNAQLDAVAAAQAADTVMSGMNVGFTEAQEQERAERER